MKGYDEIEKMVPLIKEVNVKLQIPIIIGCYQKCLINYPNI